MDKLELVEELEELETLEEENGEDAPVEDLSGIRRELEAIWTQLEEVKEIPSFLGYEPEQSGEIDLEEDLMPYEVRLRHARGEGDLLAALKIKQEAAKAGLVLL